MLPRPPVSSRVRRSPAVALRAGVAAVVVLCATLSVFRVAGDVLPVQRPTTAITHIVFIMEENRSFDSLFGRFPRVDGATRATALVSGRLLTFPLVPAPPYLWHDVGHDVADIQAAVDHGKMDGFSGEAYADVLGDKAAYQQAGPADLPNLFAYARHYTLSDRTFAPMAGPTFPVHMYTIGADSLGVISNPQQAGNTWGCDAPPQAYVLVQQSATHFTRQYPCFMSKTIVDAFNRAGVSWRYYAAPVTDLGYIWSTLDAYRRVRLGAQWRRQVVDERGFETDARAGRLPAFSWVTPRAATSMHPPNTICAGQSWLVSKINAVMQGPDWAHTLIVVTWDDWGGYYDHVNPPPAPRGSYGLRVPLLLISPYARQGYVSHTVYSFESVLKTAEELWHLPSLNAHDRAAHDLFDSLAVSGKAAPRLVQRPRSCPAALTDTTDLALLNTALQQLLTGRLGLPYARIEALHRTHSFKDVARLRQVDPLALLHEMKALVKVWVGGRVLLGLTTAQESRAYTDSVLRALDRLYNAGPGPHVLPIKPVS